MRHLELKELFIGAWVQWPAEASAPWSVDYLDGEGSVGFGHGKYCKVEELLGLPINADVLRHFGFTQGRGDVWVMEFGDIRLTVSVRPMRGGLPCRRVAISGRFSCWNEEIRHVHELQRWWVDKVLLPYGLSLDLKWKGNGHGQE